MNVQNKKIRIAVQNKGRLMEPSLAYLRSLGLEFEPDGRNLIAQCRNRAVEILFVRNSDIPEYVKWEVADLGIVGENVLWEKGNEQAVLERLGFGKCELVVAVPEKSEVRDVEDLVEERIATSYPNILKKYLKGFGISAAVIEINGSVEITPSLGLADAICDISQTGSTLRENRLRVIAEIGRSEAVLIGKTDKFLQIKEAAEFLGNKNEGRKFSNLEK